MSATRSHLSAHHIVTQLDDAAILQAFGPDPHARTRELFF